MPLLTARDLITKALKELGIGAEGETPSAETMNDGLDSLNLMLAEWGADGLMTMSEILETFALTTAKASYLMGVTSLALPTDFNTVKPHRIIDAYLHDAAGDDTQISVIPYDQYAAIALKTTTGIPDRLAQYPGAAQQANHVMTVYLYPVPDVLTYSLILISEKPLTQITALGSTLTFTDAWKAAIVFNLAVRLAPQWNKTLHQGTIDAANSTKTAIERLTASLKNYTVDLRIPGVGAGNTGNILTGV